MGTIGVSGREVRVAGPTPGVNRDPRIRWSRDLLTAVFSAWLITGVFLDAWAHTTRPSLETFFTPWHAVLYSGFLATAGWVTGIVWRAPRRIGSRTRVLPAGYSFVPCCRTRRATLSVADLPGSLVSF